MRVLITGICLALTLCIGQNISHAQVEIAWAQRDYFVPSPTIYEYGASGLAVDSSGNAYVTGTARGTNGTLDGLILKYDAAGNLLWRKLFDGGINADESANDPVLDSSGYLYVLCGQSLPSTTNNGILLKCDPTDGHTLWTQQAPLIPYISSGLGVDGFGNVYFNRGTDVSKYDPDGNLLWQWALANIPSSSDDGHMTVDSAGNTYITGNSFFTAKLDPNGNQLWTNRYNPPGSADGGFSGGITLDNTGAAYVTGRTVTRDTFSNSVDFVTTVKYDANGNQVWNSNFRGTQAPNTFGFAYNYGLRISVNNQGQVYVAGVMDGTDLLTLKLDTAGHTLWASRGPGEYPTALIVDTNGFIYMSGTPEVEGPDLGNVIMKFDPDGTRLWLADHVTDPTAVELGTTMALGPTNTLYTIDSVFGKVTNSYLNDTNNVFIQTIKFLETNAPARPQIITPPVGQNIAEGQSATFTVQATGALSYQWFHNSETLTDQTNATLQLPQANRDDAGGYSVSVSNDSGTVLTPEVRLEVELIIPTINVHIHHPRTNANRDPVTRVVIQRSGSNVDYDLTVWFTFSGTGNPLDFDIFGGSTADLGPGSQANTYYAILRSGQKSGYFTMQAGPGGHERKNRALKFTLQPDPLYKIGHNKSVTAVATY